METMNRAKEQTEKMHTDANGTKKWLRLIPYLLLGMALLAADQMTKYWAEHVLQGKGTIDVIDGVFSLTYVRNYGAAFGMLSGKTWLLLLLTSVILIMGIWYFCRNRITNPLLLSSGAAVLAGAVGNLIDRFRLSYVIDFLEIRLFQFPVFNFADCCVVLGMIVVAFCILRGDLN